MKTRKVLSLGLALAMLVSLFTVSAFAASTDPVTATDSVDGLTVSVDYTAEKVYLEKISSTEYNVLCDSTNGYYPFSFSMIMSSRDLVNGRPEVTGTNGAFSWAYDETTGEESTSTEYGLVTLPVDSTATVTVTTTGGSKITFHCAKPNGGTSAAGSSIYAFLPAPGQFTNEGVTSGGWGDAYDSNGVLKNNTATGMSLGFFGGYVVYKFDNPVANASTNPYGADFIVYGNAFWKNSEPGCVQVSQDGKTWYDIAGSLYYKDDTVKNYSLTYQNPAIEEDAGITAAASNLGTLAAVKYSVGTTYADSAAESITTNNFHKHSWFPLNANYFTGRYGNDALDKVDELSFASRTLSGGVTDTLTLSGVKLSNVATGNTADYGFGYCDVHPNNTLGGTIAYNPYQSFTDANDYKSKTEGTSGGDPIDISWAVDENGNPVNLSSVQYVRIYTGAAQMNGIFGEISTEACGIAACTGTGSGDAEKDLTIKRGNAPVSGVSNMGTKEISLVAGAAYTYNITSGADHVYVNGKAVSCTSSTPYTIEVNLAANETQYIQIITQTGTASPFVTLLKLTGK